MEMEQADSGVVASWLSESCDLQTEILARLPEEFVYRYRLISKEWNEFLSSNYFLTKWAEAPPNGRQPRLVVCNGNPEMPCMGFCFYTRRWINPYFTLSFLHDWRLRAQPEAHEDRYISRVQSVAGFILVTRNDGFQTISRSGITIKLCNPYTRTFVDIPVPQTRLYGECIVVNESSNHKYDAAYKVVALTDNSSVQIYEPSQQDWNIAGYYPDDYKMNLNTPLVHCNGSFYGLCQRRADEVDGIACFSIRLGVTPKPIPVLFAPFPEIVPNYNLLLPLLITCESRLLLITLVTQAEGPVDKNHETIIWEFKNEHSNTVSWKWMEIARMPYLLCKEWRNKLSANPLEFLWQSCIGVGHHVCFTPSSFRIETTEAVSVVVYNLMNKTWDFLPSCPISSVFLGPNSRYGAFDNTIALVPSLHRKIR